MADFYEVWRCRGPVLEKLALMVESREKARGEELKAATDIKRVYRGKVSYTYQVYIAGTAVVTLYKSLTRIMVYLVLVRIHTYDWSASSFVSSSITTGSCSRLQYSRLV